MNAWNILETNPFGLFAMQSSEEGANDSLSDGCCWLKWFHSDHRGVLALLFTSKMHTFHLKLYKYEAVLQMLKRGKASETTFGWQNIPQD